MRSGVEGNIFLFSREKEARENLDKEGTKSLLVEEDLVLTLYPPVIGTSLGEPVCLSHAPRKKASRDFFRLLTKVGQTGRKERENDRTKKRNGPSSRMAQTGSFSQ